MQGNNLALNVDKTKELIFDYRRPPMERVREFKFLGVHITEDLTWDVQTEQVVRKTQRCLYFLRHRKNKTYKSFL